MRFLPCLQKNAYLCAPFKKQKDGAFNAIAKVRNFFETESVFFKTQIAKELCIDRSTIYRELRCNHKGVLLTANDRDTRLSLLTPFKGLLNTITSDNGIEFALHKEIAEALDADYYFAHPYHSWERGANENMNGLIRQYLPKGTSFEISRNNCTKLIQSKLNNSPPPPPPLNSSYKCNTE